MLLQTLCLLIRVASTLSTRVGASKGSQHRRRAAGLTGGWAAGEGRPAAGDSESARGGCRRQEVGVRRHCQVLFHPLLDDPLVQDAKMHRPDSACFLELHEQFARTGVGQNKTTKEPVGSQGTMYSLVGAGGCWVFVTNTSHNFSSSVVLCSNKEKGNKNVGWVLSKNGKLCH